MEKGDYVKPTLVILRYHSKYLTKDKVYKVQAAFGDTILIDDDIDRGACWSDDRFVKVSEEETLIQLLKIT